MNWKNILMRKELILVLVGVVFIVAIYTTMQPSSPKSQTTATDLEIRLQEVLRQLPGVGEVEVMITYASPQGFTQTTNEVKGVIVLAQGGGNMQVKLTLLQAIHTVLQVPVDRVEVFALAQPTE